MTDSVRAPERGVTPSLGTERTSGPPPETKRKYRRHPKPDENAPERPPSAYVIFSNKVREEVKDQNLSFTQIARLVGDRWQKLDPAGKEPFETQANAAKERYNIQLSTYRKTDAYKEYMQYLADFKSKHGQTSEVKRPKLDAESSGSIISAKSLESNPDIVSQLSGHVRGGSIGSVASSPFVGGSTQLTPSQASMPSRPPLPSSRSGTPPHLQQNREQTRPGLPSRPSSVSDESSTVRSDLQEPLMRTATLNLGVSPSSGTPPLQPQGSGALSMDAVGSPDLPARSRLPYGMHPLPSQQQQQQPPLPPNYPHLQHQHSSLSAISSMGSAQSAPNLPLPHTLSSPTMQERPWGSRPSDIRGYSDNPAGVHSSLPYAPTGTQPPNPSHFPPIFPPDRPPEYSQGAYLRTLPPPRSRSTGNHAPGESGSPMLPNPLTFRRPGPDETQSFGLQRSESDAANTLAGLATTPTPRPEPTNPLKYPPPPPRSEP